MGGHKNRLSSEFLTGYQREVSLFWALCTLSLKPRVASVPKTSSSICTGIKFSLHNTVLRRCKQAYLVNEAAECREVRLREGDKDAGCTSDTDHRAMSSIKMIQRICITRRPRNSYTPCIMHVSVTCGGMSEHTSYALALPQSVYTKYLQVKINKDILYSACV